MKVLRGCRRIADLQIVLSAELQVALESRARVLWSLSFITVRQQHHEPRTLFPLVFRSGDVLIDYRLRAVTEITKLRFPQHERILRDYRIAILKSQHAFFRQRTVVNIKSRIRIRF